VRSSVLKIEYLILPEYVLAEKLNLKDQYDSQVKMLNDLGLLNADINREGREDNYSIVGVDGKKYPLPSYDDIMARFRDPEKRAFLEEKFEQGFTKLLLVPFALKLSSIINSYKEELIKIKKSGDLRRSDGRRLGISMDEPVSIALGFDVVDDVSDGSDIMIRGDMEYKVKNYEGATRELRGGKSKKELLKNSRNAWEICLIEDLPDLPKTGNGLTKGGRKQIESSPNNAPKQASYFFDLLQNNKQYQGESGQTPEAAFITWLAYLHERKIVIDDSFNNGSANWLVGTFHTCGINYGANQGVPLFFWDNERNRASVHCYGPKTFGSNHSVRTTVKI
jgi:hypothetical protein